MSAYVVDKAHIDAMIRGAEAVLHRVGGGFTWRSRDPEGLTMQELQETYRRLDHSDRDAVGQMLWDECVASVGYRYQDSITNLPGQIDAPWLLPYKYDYLAGGNRYGEAPSPVAVLKLIDCYCYQSCEHPGWHTSEARLFCQALKNVTIGTLPGYDDAPWGWPPEPVTQTATPVS